MKNKLTSRQKQSLETKNRIFTCATDLFAQKSYEEVRISDICNAAHVSIGSFYHHFATKESIINEGYREFDIRVQKAWAEYRRVDLFEDICFLIRFQLEMISTNGYRYALQFFKSQLNNQEKYILNPDRFFYIVIRDLVSEGIQSQTIYGDVHVITENVLRVSRGTIYDWCLHEGAYALIPCGIEDVRVVLEHYKIPRHAAHG